MEITQKIKATAGDFFLHLGVVAVLYVFVGFLLSLLFTVIDVAYPPVGTNYYINPSISFPVAALIVLFPVFVLLSYIMYRSYDLNQDKKQLGVRKWLTFLTLFITGAIVAGDLITVIYYFLDGRDLTTSFFLKASALLAVAAIIFIYYAQDLREKISSGQRKIWLALSLLLTIGAIAGGFSVIGSPSSQRLARLDQQKINDLQNIQWQIVNYWQSKQKLPQTLADLNDPISGQIIPTDTQKGIPYVYSTGEAFSFKLCADFNADSSGTSVRPVSIPVYVMDGKNYDPQNSNWQHGSGQVCFDRTIDPERYPPNVKK